MSASAIVIGTPSAGDNLNAIATGATALEDSPAAAFDERPAVSFDVRPAVNFDVSPAAATFAANFGTAKGVRTPSRPRRTEWCMVGRAHSWIAHGGARAATHLCYGRTRGVRFRRRELAVARKPPHRRESDCDIIRALGALIWGRGASVDAGLHRGEPQSRNAADRSDAADRI